MPYKPNKKYEALPFVSQSRGWSTLMIEMGQYFNVVLVPGKFKFGAAVPDNLIPPVVKDTYISAWFRSDRPTGSILRAADKVFVFWPITYEFLNTAPHEYYGDAIWVAVPGHISGSVDKVKIYID